MLIEDLRGNTIRKALDPFHRRRRFDSCGFARHTLSGNDPCHIQGQLPQLLGRCPRLATHTRMGFRFSSGLLCRRGGGLEAQEMVAMGRDTAVRSQALRRLRVVLLALLHHAVLDISFSDRLGCRGRV